MAANEFLDPMIFRISCEHCASIGHSAQISGHTDPIRYRFPTDSTPIHGNSGLTAAVRLPTSSAVLPMARSTLTAALLSFVPGQYEDATVPGIRAVLERARADGATIEVVRVGTTVATNALLERKGARTVLVTNSGLGDALAIGTQERPHLFRRDIELPAPLYERVIECSARLSVDGTELSPLRRALYDRHWMTRDRAALTVSRSS
jgi:hypothetical protein